MELRRSLARRRYASRSTVPVVDDGSLSFPNAGSQEVRVLAQLEERKSVMNDVADYVTPYVLSEPNISNALKMQVYQAAIARFRHRLSPDMIRKLVDATILQENCRREEIAAYRRAKARKKREASSARRMVAVSSSSEDR